MIFYSRPIKDKFLENIYKNSMKDLNGFYGIGWVFGLPRLIVVKNRKEIDSLRGEQTERWLVGWSEGKNIYILSRQNLEKESNHEYKKDIYTALIKHEISHSFYSILSSSFKNPRWLCEGTAIYTSGQNKFKKPIQKFSNFLDYYDHYFKTGTSKEKIREINGDKVEKISYNRSEIVGRKKSEYNIQEISQEEKKELLNKLKVLCVVDKIRRLWIYKNTRIHLDNVIGLGYFLELETVIKDISAQKGRMEFKEVIDLFGISLTKAVACSYSDLIYKKYRIYEDIYYNRASDSLNILGQL